MTDLPSTPDHSDPGTPPSPSVRVYRLCPACGYDTRGVPQGSVCPECGSDLIASDAAHLALRESRLKSRARSMFFASPALALPMGLLGLKWNSPVIGLAIASLIAAASGARLVWITSGPPSRRDLARALRWGPLLAAGYGLTSLLLVLAASAIAVGAGSIVISIVIGSIIVPGSHRIAWWSLGSGVAATPIALLMFVLVVRLVHRIAAPVER